MITFYQPLGSKALGRSRTVRCRKGEREKATPAQLEEKNAINLFLWELSRGCVSSDAVLISLQTLTGLSLPPQPQASTERDVTHRAKPRSPPASCPVPLLVQWRRELGCVPLAGSHPLALSQTSWHTFKLPLLSEPHSQRTLQERRMELFTVWLCLARA